MHLITFCASQWISHPSYSYSFPGHDNDFAIIKLSGSVTFNARVSPVCLPSLFTNYDSKVATVTGWGSLSSGGISQPSILKKVIELEYIPSICFKKAFEEK